MHSSPVRVPKIATSCWTTINRRMLEPTKEDISCPKTKRKPPWEGKVKGISVMSNSLWSHGLYSPWNYPGQNTGVGSLSLLQGIFPTQESNPGLPHCRRILYQLSHKGSPKWGTIMIKSNPIHTRWVTHRLENNNTKEVLALLWRF